MVTFRSILRWLAPSWLYDEITQSHTLLLDEHMARARAGLEARFPSRAQSDALDLIGQDRGIFRGRTETAAHYAQRLIAWRYPRGHRVRGLAFALLNQISEFFGGVYCWTIDRRGNRHTRTADGVESFEYLHSWTWYGPIGGGGGTLWGRFWIVIDLQGVAMPHPAIGDPTLWGGTVGPADREYTIGQLGVTPSDIAAIRRLLYGAVPWRPDGTIGDMAVITFDGSTPVPDTGWQTWAGRDPNFRYWSLAP